jgi:predicted secreted protein
MPAQIQENFMLKNALCTLITASLLTLGACQSPPKGPQPAPLAGRDTVTINQDSNGGQVALKQGQTLVVQLPKSTPRGMVWEMDSMPDQGVIMPDGQRRVRTGEQIRYDSLLSYQELRFQAIAPGMTTLNLAYDRPGGGEGEVQSRFTVDVIVEPSP